MKIGFIGLGKMGGRMASKLLREGHELVVWNRSRDAVEEFKIQNSKFKSTTSHFAKASRDKQKLKIAKTIQDLVKSLEAPRVIWLMVTAGEAVDEVLSQLADNLTPNDLVIDGGNSFYKDTLRRNETLSKKNIHFMDVGTSGGIESAGKGACLMVGGAKEDFETVKDLLKGIAAPDAFGLLGPVGSGHFAKMIHNGIEYGMMEAIGEGAAILKHSQFKYDLREVFRVYSIKSIIESRLVSWTLAELREDPQLSNISSVIGSAGGAGKTKGEAHWMVELAKEIGVQVPVIEASIRVRDESEKDLENSPAGFRNKIVAAMRWQFGQHPVKKK